MPQMASSGFPRQFFAAPHPVDGFPQWERASLGPLHVYAHPELGVAQAGDGTRVVLLGFAIDPHFPELGNAELAARVAAGRTFGEVVAASMELAGRWVLLVAIGEETYVIHDACGLRMVHYTLTAGGPYLASNPALLGALTPLRPAPFAAGYMASEYRRRNVEDWLPSGATLFDNVGHLVPNHALHLGTGRQLRYWPDRELPRHSMEEGVERAVSLLGRLIDAGAARFPLALPLTAGWDSRILLAAARPRVPDLFAYTLLYRDLTERTPEVRIPTEMLAASGLEHHRIECMEPPPPEFLAAYRANVDLPHDDWARIAWGMQRGYPRERVCLKGNCAEIARNSYYADFRARPTPRAIAEREFGGLPFAEAALERWMGPASEAAALSGMEVVDLLFLEHRMGSWQARSQLEWDVVQEVFTPYNYRPLMMALWGVPARDRDKPRVRMWHALLAAQGPDLARWPVNPLPAGTRLRLAARGLIARAGLLGPAQRLLRSRG